MTSELREKEAAQLTYLLNADSDVYVHGPSGSGKSLLVKRVLAPEQRRLWLNCSMLPGLKHVLRQLIYIYIPSTKKISTAAQFQLQLMKAEQFSRETKLVLVLDQVDKLLSVDRTAVHVLHKLRTETHIRLTLVLISEVYMTEVFRTQQVVCGDFRPVPVYIPQFSREEVTLILRQEYKPENETLLEAFMETVYQVFSTYSQRINLYRYVYEQLYPEFLQHTHSEFYKKVSEVCDSLFDRTNSRPAGDLDDVGVNFLEKLLLLSSFLCSHTQPKSDFVVFKRLKLKTKRRSSAGSKYLETAIQFPYERLLAVFQILYHDVKDEHFQESIQLQATVGSLIEKKTLKANQPGRLQGMKLLSFVTQEEAISYSTELGMKLQDYLSS